MDGSRSHEMMGEQAMAAAGQREEDFVQDLASLEADAWRRLFQEQYQRVYSYAYIRTRNVADAEDIASTVFTEAVRSIGSFRCRGAPVAAWLLRIAHHETVDHLKRRRRAEVTSLENPEAADGLAAADAVGPADDWRDAADALGSLRPEHREVLVLRLVEGHSVREVAALLGKSEGAVKVTQMRALKAVRARLSGRE